MEPAVRRNDGWLRLQEAISGFCSERNLETVLGFKPSRAAVVWMLLLIVARLWKPGSVPSKELVPDLKMLAKGGALNPEALVGQRGRPADPVREAARRQRAESLDFWMKQHGKTREQLIDDRMIEARRIAALRKLHREIRDKHRRGDLDKPAPTDTPLA